MYLPPVFEEADPGSVQALIEAFPLAVVVAQTADGLAANHIPLLQTGAGELIGHISRGNDMHRVLADGADVLVIFRGDDAYISPNWYPSKADHHKVVPTWNYSAVHMYGKIYFQHDEKSKRATVGLLTKRHESRVNGAAGWRMADAPADFMATALEHIVAFRIETGRILAKSKLSQNREARDAANVADVLEGRGLAAMAADIRRVRGGD